MAENESIPPGKMSIKGSGAISDLADNCFVVWRNKHKEQSIQTDKIQEKESDSQLLSRPDCLLICEKQRNGEWEGKTALWFDKKSFQYLNYQGHKPVRYVAFQRK